MSKKALTDAAIKSLQPRDHQYEVFDSKIPGFGVRVSPGGTKSFFDLFRIGGRPRRLVLGRYPTLSLADARRMAQEALGKVAKGIDPQAEKLQARASDRTNLFSSVADEFIENHAKRNTRSWKETERILRNEFVRAWGKLPVSQITKPMVHSRLDEVVKNNGPSAANHAHAVIRCCLNWCEQRGYIEKSPCLKMKKPAKTVERKRVLSDQELSAVLRAADATPYPFGPFTKLLIATGQRRGEVSGMRWRDLDLGNRVWTQPRESNKTWREHVVPLNHLALDTLSSLPRIHDVFVFPARGKDRPMSGYSKSKRKLDQLSGVKDWTLHDLRRTAATGLARLKVPLHITELILNHRSTELSGIAGVYNQHPYLDDRHKALELWGQYVEQLVQQSQQLAA